MKFTIQDVNRHESRIAAGRKRELPVMDELEQHDGLESELQADIRKECVRRRWVCITSRMDKKTRTKSGTTDFVIAADNGRTFYIECKRRGNKLSPDQTVMKHCLLALGHKWACVYSLAEFMEAVK